MTKHTLIPMWLLLMATILLCVGCGPSRSPRLSAGVCVTNMLYLWSSAKSIAYVTRHNTNMVETIGPATAMGYPNIILHVSSFAHVFTQAVVKCPVGGVYPDFALYDGPSCPNGHHLSSDQLRAWRFLVRGPTNKEDLIHAFSDQSGAMRCAAVQYTRAAMRVSFLSAAEARWFLEGRLVDCELYVREAAQHELAGLSVGSNTIMNLVPLENLLPIEIRPTTNL